MASVPLVSHYLRYKAGTNRLIHWLASSAQKLNDRQARASGAARQPTVPKTVTLDTLVEYAQLIVDARDPSIEISTAILDVTKDAIIGRTMAMKWYQELADNGDSAGMNDMSALRKANSTHKYFLRVLEKIWDILNREHKSRRPKRKKQRPKLASLENDLTNLFQHLHIDEPADIPDDELIPERNTEFVPPVATPDGFRLDNEREDNLFAVWCLLKDMSDIRLHLKGVWQQYKQGNISFISAAKVAGSAMCMCGQLADQFTELHPEMSDFDKLMAAIGAQDSSSVAMDAQMHYANRAAFSQYCDGLQIQPTVPHADAELLCRHAWQALESFRRMQRYVWSDESERRDLFSGRRPSINISGSPFTKVLLDLAFELKQTFPSIGPRHFDRAAFTQVAITGDLFLSHLLAFSTCGQMNIGLVAATQIYADMHDQLGDTMSCILQECERAHKFLTKAKQKYVSVCNDVAWSEARDNTALLIEREQNGARGWIFRIPEGAPDPFTAGEIFIPESILKALPLLPANIVRYHLHGAQHHAIEHMSEYGILLSAVHLYHAGRMSQAISAPWDDMDFFIERQETRGVSLRLRGTTPRSIANHFLIAMGHSPAEVTKKEPRMLTPMQAESKRVKFVSACLLDMVLNRSKSTTELRLLYQVVEAYRDRIQDEKIKQQYLATRRLTPVQLLQVAQEVIVDDEPHLFFDYANFLNLCKKWVVDTCNLTTKARGIHGPYLYVPTNYILWQAADADERHQSKLKTHLCQAGKLANQLIARRGSKYKAQALKLASSRIDQGETTGEQTDSRPMLATGPY
ncbi:hypothetical protein CKM354_000697600 [Cercospora kikuchii]|uniref:DUF6604 domain-containing protein n=1 Tax=Cercospora kikuchii TaxID=84275 RepID=A0A9P3CKD4_9PEZI|nr:uncharacterized protein CKM354_000697600 [Cercospora kikuchii]GIZ43761.1 hypothetical protein CKM354_000697600 [Cercospora kikuchii]